MSKEEIQSILTNATYLQEDSVVIRGIKFFGSPMMTTGPRMAFRSTDDPVDVWKVIPSDCQVLITHIPPYGILDYKTGCQELKNRVDEIKPIVHLFGHIHGAYGTLHENGTTFINCAIQNDILNPVVYFDLKL
jgi:Icc-related predicted phosphoesterase